ncbi:MULTISPECIES: SGNH/GDSL hydrolase family protein [Roseivirga]|nr:MULTISPECIES: hypothetical protein [Roseivirga]MBO6659738.1 hypothetical protein [Roseivirga sp.]MBO6907525.1 hypothetical protein [Roseivirga sp.]WPZ09899.1 hypothetical protein T7867_16660 [Roseivirga spongicola]
MKYQRTKLSFTDQLGYFLLLPNLIFPLFPVVDYKLYQSNYYQRDELEIYKRGAGLVAKGVFHLFVYRIIYSYLLPEISELTTQVNLLKYLVFSYLLTIRLSGIFHFSVGVLCLLGYDLPDIFKNHFAASGFGDLWRRINIYWKDFIVKVYFNPLYFRLKKYGTKVAIFWVTLLSFAITLLLHDYQFFWLTGVFDVDVTDVIFWGFFGFTIAFGTILSSKRALEKSVASKAFDAALKILGTFLIMSVLWSIWSSESLSSWWWLIRNSWSSQTSEILELLLVLVVPLLALWVSNYFLLRKNNKVISDIIMPNLFWPIAMLTLVLVFNTATLKGFWNERLEGKNIQALFHFTLNPDDREVQLAGYYDNMLDNHSLMSPIINGNNDYIMSELFRQEIYGKKVLLKTNDARYTNLAASKTTDVTGIEIDINQWGMRDDDIEKTPIDNKYRIALAGGSVEMGWMIPKEQRFDDLIELELKSKGYNFDILNFSVPGRLFINSAYTAKEEILDFNPDVLLMFYHPHLEWIHIKNRLSGYDFSLEYDGAIYDLYESSNLLRTKGKSLDKLLDSRKEGILNKIFFEVKKACDQSGVELLIVNMPVFSEYQWEENDLDLMIAEELGINVLDISQALHPNEAADYTLDFGGHPNVKGHQLIFDNLYPYLHDLVKKNASK